MNAPAEPNTDPKPPKAKGRAALSRVFKPKRAGTTGSPAQARASATSGLPAIPPYLRLALHPLPIFFYMMLPIAMVFTLIGFDLSVMIYLLMGVVVVWLGFMLLLYQWLRTYFRNIPAEHFEASAGIVAEVSGGLAQAFTGAIIAVGVGGATAYYQHTSHQNDLMLQNRQWKHEQTLQLLEDLTSHGYGSLFVLKSAKERMVWLLAVKQQVTSGAVQDPTQLRFPPDNRSYIETIARYEELAKEYSTSKGLDSILSGIKAMLIFNDDHAEDLVQLQKEIDAQVTYVAGKLHEIENYRLKSQAIAPDDPALWDQLNVLTDDCSTGVDQLRVLIQEYLARSMTISKGQLP